jgi:hypothetical protein
MKASLPAMKLNYFPETDSLYIDPACRAVASGSPKPCEGGLAKEGEKLGNPTDLELLQKTFDRMK